MFSGNFRYYLEREEDLKNRSVLAIKFMAQWGKTFLNFIAEWNDGVCILQRARIIEGRLEVARV